MNDFNKFASVVEGATLIAELICRYAIFEDLYLRYSSPATDELKRALVKLYTAAMIYLSKAKNYFDQNSASKDSRAWGRALWQATDRRIERIIISGFVESDLDGFLNAIGIEQAAVDRYADLVNVQCQ